MMQPSGRTMHNGKIYELWGDELWEYSPDVETGETTVRVVGQVGTPPTTDSLRDAAPDLLAALEKALPSICSCESMDCTQYDVLIQALAAIAKARGG